MTVVEMHSLGVHPLRTARHAAEELLPRSVLVRRVHTRARRLALTLDDGPDYMTSRYLDVLDDLGVPATFFLVGEACARLPGVVLDIVRRGHEVGGHGYTHRPFSELSGDELRDELAALGGRLPPSLGRPLVRPPYGALSLRALATCARAGWTTVLWSRDSDDCRVADTASVVARVAPERVRPGDILLFHEGQRWTIDALSPVVCRLRDAGYELVTVTELLHG